MRSRLLEIAALLSLAAAGATQQTTPTLAGRWQYLQPPDTEGEVLDLSVSSGRWRGIMNGLERAGEHGLFYYAAEIESIEVGANGAIRFEVGERVLSSKRSALSAVGGSADASAGVVRDRMRFIGRLEGGDLVLRCTGSGGSCPDSTMRFKRVGAEPGLGGRDTAGFIVAARFSVTDAADVIEHPLGSGSGLRILARREPGMGWSVSVIPAAGGSDAPNLLYHSRSWHGPYPTEVFAWSSQRRLFPDDRLLPVYGHPYEIRIRLLDCRVSRTGDQAVFQSGTIEIAWRRAAVKRAALE